MIHTQHTLKWHDVLKDEREVLFAEIFQSICRFANRNKTTTTSKFLIKLKSSCSGGKTKTKMKKITHKSHH
ncbi:hypothetical protein DOY81_001292 [Sarcophaga bullata]|nr:hypothetical protein DOY81_001292 [Sarcophaga bullata]